MRNRGQLIFGVVLVFFGLVFLMSTLFNVDLWPFCWSIGLIGLGVWLVLRPRLAGPGMNTEVSLIGDFRRAGSWEVKNEEIWIGVGDVDLDFLQTSVSPGETVLRIYTFVSDIDIFIPRTVGVAVHAAGLVVDAKLLGQEEQTFLSPVEVTSEGYASADCKVRIELTGFVCDISVRQM